MWDRMKETSHICQESANILYTSWPGLFILHIYKQPIEPLSRQGETCFPNSERPKKNSCLPKQSTNKSTERHSRVRYQLQSNHCKPLLTYYSLYYYLSPRVGLGIRRKLRGAFFCSEVHDKLDV